jgi:hypothetical protein
MNKPTALAGAPSRPWYREPWPWIIMAAPAAAVVGGAVMLWLAIATDDGLVVDDYYKQGLGINQVLRRDETAFELRYEAHASLSEDSARMRVLLSSARGAPLPDALQLHLAHPTRAGKDQSSVLQALSPGWYEAGLSPPETAGWLVTIEDTAKTWRLSGRWHLPQERAIVLKPPSPDR